MYIMLLCWPINILCVSMYIYICVVMLEVSGEVFCCSSVKGCLYVHNVNDLTYMYMYVQLSIGWCTHSIDDRRRTVHSLENRLTEADSLVSQTPLHH